MGVLDEIKNTVENSISKEEAMSILKDLILKAIKNEAKSWYNKFIKEAKEKATKLEYSTVNGHKAIVGKLRIDDCLFYHTEDSKEKESFFFHQKFSYLTKDDDLLRYINVIEYYRGDFYIHVKLASYSSNLKRVKKRFFYHNTTYYSYYLTKIGEALYNEILNLIKDEQIEISLHTKVYQTDSSFGRDIGLPCETEDYRGSEYYPYIRYTIICE